MYTLTGFLTSILGMAKDEMPSREMYCSESNTQKTFPAVHLRQRGA